MGDMRPELSKKSRYYITKHAFYTAYHFALQYSDWVSEYKLLTDSLKGQGMVVGGGGMPGKPTENTGIKRAELSSRIELIEQTAKEADPDLASFILLGATGEKADYKYLARLGMPCSRGTYYDRRRKFYFLLSRKI